MLYEIEAKIGRPNPRYQVRSAPTGQPWDGTDRQRALDERYENRRVTIRTTRYTNVERTMGDEGIKRGRFRLRRQIALLNRLDAVVFPEPLDCFEDTNREENFLDSALRDHEPVLIYQFLTGTDVAELIKQRYFLGRMEQDDGRVPPHRFQVTRVARLLVRVVGLLQPLLDARIAHIDLQPAHFLLSERDEIPRLLGPGHLVELDGEGRVVDDDPCLRFTTAGFAAPELVSPAASWGQGVFGEAVMLYGLGATMLCIASGAPLRLPDLVRADGVPGVGDWIKGLEQDLRRDEPSRASKRLKFLGLARELLAVSPEVRLSKNTLQRARERLVDIAGDRRVVTDFRCEWGGHSASDPRPHLFDYQGKSFQFCSQHWRDSRVMMAATCESCKKEYHEYAVFPWARGKTGCVARKYCNDCKAGRRTAQERR